ncbi:MAG: hypothetical protein QOG54_995 [Actinomycetota bacterium]|jgi:hypothetical protein|nr:hypothetical protein [Actinomycetota bacterium]
MADRSTGIAQPEPGRTSVSPLKAFAVGLFLLAILLATILISRNQSPPTTAPPATTTNITTLTNPEALAEFKRLDAARIEAYLHSDQSMLTDIYTRSSAVGTTATEEIETLRSTGIRADPRFKTLSLRIVSNGQTQIQIRQHVIDSSRFFDETGKDVSTGPSRETMIVLWTLEFENDVWKIKDSVVEARD